jgi:hypothetical protein
MGRLLPVKYSFETTLTQKRIMRKLDGDTVEYRPTVNVLSKSKFMKKYKQECVFYGRHGYDDFELFYHRAGKRDGGSTGFYGKVTKTENGSLISGWFRKPVYTYVFGAVWAILCLMCSLGTYAAGSAVGALVFLGLAVAGVLILLWDNSEMYLRSYLDEFPRVPENDEK